MNFESWKVVDNKVCRFSLVFLLDGTVRVMVDDGISMVKSGQSHSSANLVCGLGVVATLLGSFAQAGPTWDRPSLHLGSLDVDGGLRQRFQLGTLSGSPEFSFSIYLEHGFRIGEALSEYRVPQLETYVVPEGRDGIAWLEPGGIRHEFKHDEILEAAPERPVEPWVAVKLGPADYEFHSDDGWIYRYEGGAIVSLAAPTGRMLEFETEGLRISRIFQSAGEREITLLDAGENEIGLLGELRIGPETHEFAYSEESEQLARWHAPQMGRNSVSFTYSADGLLDGITLPGDKTHHYTWGGRDGAWQKESGFKLPETERGVFLVADDDFKFQYGLSKQGVHLMRTDALGIREGFCFNPKTQQLVRYNRDGGESTEFYGLRGPSRSRLESARDPQGREAVRLTYDDKGRVTTRTVPGQAPIRFKYDNHDRISKVFRLDQLQKSYEYEGESERPVKITNALGDTIEIAYMPDGQVKRYKNLDGVVYEFIYDDLGQLIEEKHPMGYTKTIERDAFGRVTRVQEIDGRVTNWTYDKANRLAGVEKDGSNWQYEYDPDGQLSRLLRDGKTWQKTEREKVADTGEMIVRETNSKGDETVHQFDQDGNLVKQVDALGQATRFHHDKLGQLSGWEDAGGSSVEFERDALGRVAGVESGESAKLEMAYDLTGRIRRKNNGEQNVRYDYDRAGQLVLIDYGKGQTIDYTYDDYGRVLTALTGQGVRTSYTWDALDRRTSERNDIPGLGYTLLEWTYTPSGLKKSVSVRKGGANVTTSGTSPISTSGGAASAGDRASILQKTEYAYDDLGRYTAISVNGEERIWYDYHPKTLHLVQKRYWNDWRIAYEHFASGRPKSIVATDGEGRTITDCHYIWANNGKLDQRLLNGVSHQYHYDSLGRLTEVIKTKPGDTKDRAE